MRVARPPRGGWTYVREGCSAADGTFTTGGAPAGDYHVQFSRLGLPQQYYSQALTLDIATPVSVVAPGDTTIGDATILRGGSVSGSITDGSGNPVPGCVQAYRDGAPYGPDSACAGADGRYTLEGLAAGSYRITASGQYGSGYLTTTYPIDVVVTEGGSVDGIDFTVALGGEVNGTVTDAATGAPLNGVTVALRLPPVPDPSGSPGYPQWTSWSAITDEQGHYSIRGVEPGDYYVYANVDGFVSEWHEDALSPSSAALIRVQASQSLPVDFALAQIASLDLLVLDPSGAPAPDVSVTLWQSLGGSTWQTDPAGRVTLSSVVPGNYVIEFNDWAQGRFPQQFYNGKLTRETADPVTLAPGSAINLTAHLIGATLHSISGTVADATSHDPVAGATVTAWAPGTDTSLATATTGADGSYALTLPQVSVQISVTAGTAYRETWWVDAATRDSAATLVVSGPQSGVDVALPRVPRINGVVTDSVTAVPLTGITVAAIPVGQTAAVAQTTTGSDGRYEIGGLAIGSYVLSFDDGTGPYLTEFSGGVYVAAQGNAVELTVGAPWQTADGVLDKPGSISGAVTGAGGKKERACVQVWAADARTAVGSPVCVAGGGSFRVADLVPGTYLVSVTQKNGQTSWYVAAASAATAAPVVVGSGATVSGIDISVKGKPKA